MTRTKGKSSSRSRSKGPGLRLRKSLGQHFLTDSSVVDRMVDLSGLSREDLALEIGPGDGVLTDRLADVAGRVAAIEIDQRLLPILRSRFALQPQVTFIQGDVLKVDLADLIRRESTFPDGSQARSVRVLGNLPYYITTPILMRLLEEVAGLTSITVMVQKEVADRMAAPPGSRTYGALSVAVQYYCRVTYGFTVPRTAFRPPPAVDSAVIHLELWQEPPVPLTSEQAFFACVRKGFGQRRKTLANAMRGLWNMNKEETEAWLAACGIDGGRRAETLSLEEFAALANRLEPEAPTDTDGIAPTSPATPPPTSPTANRPDDPGLQHTASQKEEEK